MLKRITPKRAGMFCLRWGLTILIGLIVLVPLYWITISSFTPYEELFLSLIHIYIDQPHIFLPRGYFTHSA